MNTIGVVCLCLVGGYIGGVVIGSFLVATFSRSYDKSVEAAMTSLFFYGPVTAVLSAIIGGVLHAS